MPISEAKINILSRSPSHCQALKIARRIWLVGTLLEAQKYPHGLMESMEYCHLSALSSLLSRANLQRHPQRYCPTVLLEFTVLFLVVFAMRFIPTLVFVTSTCAGEGACVRSLTCTVNWSLGKSFTLA